MKLFVLAAVVCLALLTLTTWNLVTPAYAASATASCGPGGGSITCSGTQCSSNDATSTNGGGSCSCLRADGSYDLKSCSYRDAPAPEEGPVS